MAKSLYSRADVRRFVFHLDAQQLAADEVAHLEPRLGALGATMQAFWGQNLRITHLVTRSRAQAKLRQAKQWGIRCWSVEDCKRLVAKWTETERKTLERALHNENVYGVASSAAPDDFVAFRDYYLLVEDAAHVHAPVACKEYARNRHDEWPSYPRLALVAGTGRSPFLPPEPDAQALAGGGGGGRVSAPGGAGANAAATAAALAPQRRHTTTAAVAAATAAAAAAALRAQTAFNSIHRRVTGPRASGYVTPEKRKTRNSNPAAVLDNNGAPAAPARPEDNNDGQEQGSAVAKKRARISGVSDHQRRPSAIRPAIPDAWGRKNQQAQDAAQNHNNNNNNNVSGNNTTTTTTTTLVDANTTALKSQADLSSRMPRAVSRQMKHLPQADKSFIFRKPFDNTTNKRVSFADEAAAATTQSHTAHFDDQHQQQHQQHQLQVRQPPTVVNFVERLNFSDHPDFDGQRAYVSDLLADPVIRDWMCIHQPSLDEATRPPYAAFNKPGYCETCNRKFDDLFHHWKGRRHQIFATSMTNFEQFDLFVHEYAVAYPYEVVEEEQEEEHDAAPPVVSASDIAAQVAEYRRWRFGQIGYVEDENKSEGDGVVQHDEEDAPAPEPVDGEPAVVDDVPVADQTPGRPASRQAEQQQQQSSSSSPPPPPPQQEQVVDCASSSLAGSSEHGAEAAAPADVETKNSAEPAKPRAAHFSPVSSDESDMNRVDAVLRDRAMTATQATSAAVKSADPVEQEKQQSPAPPPTAAARIPARAPSTPICIVDTPPPRKVRKVPKREFLTSRHAARPRGSNYRETASGTIVIDSTPLVASENAPPPGAAVGVDQQQQRGRVTATLRSIAAAAPQVGKAFVASPPCDRRRPLQQIQLPPHRVSNEKWSVYAARTPIRRGGNYAVRESSPDPLSIAAGESEPDPLLLLGDSSARRKSVGAVYLPRVSAGGGAPRVAPRRQPRVGRKR